MALLGAVGGANSNCLLRQRRRCADAVESGVLQRPGRPGRTERRLRTR